MVKSWKCEICGESVSELGAYVKLAHTRYAHWSCQEEACFNQGRAMLRAEQEAARAAQREQEIARERAEAERRAEVAERERTNRILAAQKIPLPPRVTGPAAEPKRCVRCQKPIEIPSTEHPNTCGVCWNSNAPTKAVADAAKPLDKLDETRKRFSLIDMD